MILHEWATNSVKYGALGSDDGALSVTWERHEEGLVLDWCERMARVAEPRPRPGLRHPAGGDVPAPARGARDA
ncbi:hypothetical protein ACU4GR_06175 [Methylobacterium oryzae CBMB20]